jgi:hypothetical protein
VLGLLLTLNCPAATTIRAIGNGQHIGLLLLVLLLLLEQLAVSFPAPTLRHFYATPTVERHHLLQ